MADSLRDPETGLLNEAYFNAALPNRTATARRGLRPISLGLLALASPADAALVGRALRGTVRESDTACRLDDGRFVVLLEDTPEDGAVWMLERLRRLLAGEGAAVVLWGGVASYPTHTLDSPDLLRRAEDALTAAQDWPAGRIQVADGT